MSNANSLRLVAAPPVLKNNAVAVIATAEPELFAGIDMRSGFGEVHICDNSKDAIAALDAYKPASFFADFLPLHDGARWTGPRFLRHIMDSAHAETVRVWLIADHIPEYQVEWFAKQGAAGFVLRNATAVANKIAGAKLSTRKPVQPHKSIGPELSSIDEEFAKFSGSLGSVHIEDARSAIKHGDIEPSSKAYSMFLAHRLTIESMRTEFLLCVNTRS